MAHGLMDLVGRIDGSGGMIKSSFFDMSSLKWCNIQEEVPGGRGRCGIWGRAKVQHRCKFDCYNFTSIKIKCLTLKEIRSLLDAMTCLLPELQVSICPVLCLLHQLPTDDKDQSFHLHIQQLMWDWPEPRGYLDLLQQLRSTGTATPSCVSMGEKFTSQLVHHCKTFNWD